MYSTQDIKVAVVLLCGGYEIEKVENVHGSVYSFVFKKNIVRKEVPEDPEEYVMTYLSDRLLLNPREVLNRLSEVKSIVANKERLKGPDGGVWNRKAGRVER